MGTDKVCVLLPTFNEEKSIKEMIERVRKVNENFSIYVIDSGSTDKTLELTRSSGANLILLDKRGKGVAIRKAFEELNGDFVVILDSDSSYSPEQIPVLLEKLQNCDVVVGSRFKGTIEKGSMKFLNRVGNFLLSLMASILYFKEISDVCSGFWAFKMGAYKIMKIDAPHFELEANFFVECARKKLKLCEVPISYGVRQGKTKLNPLYGISIGWYLISKRILA